jgi:hypothetical protein
LPDLNWATMTTNTQMRREGEYHRRLRNDTQLVYQVKDGRATIGRPVVVFALPPELCIQGTLHCAPCLPSTTPGKTNASERR